jgi:hypothetical protein
MQRGIETSCGLLAPTDNLTCDVGIPVLVFNQLRQRFKSEAPLRMTVG